jgi:magnesium-transporting ATPase (P-type)
MYQKHILVKNLQIIETFNSISIIATDKTGTLTQDKTVVTHLVWDTERIYQVPMSEPHPKKTMGQRIRRLSTDVTRAARRLSEEIVTVARKLSMSNNSQTDVLPTPIIHNESDYFSNVPSEISMEVCKDLLLGAILCNNAEEQRLHEPHIQQDTSNVKSELRLVGDIADIALYELCASHSYCDISTVRKMNPRLPDLPFYSTNKLMISANQLASDAQSGLETDRTVSITMKGTPTVVIQHCSSYKNSVNEIFPLDDKTRQNLINRQDEFGRRGYQVIAMCQQKLTQQHYDRIVEQCTAVQTSRLSIEEHTVGFGLNDNCFLGFLLLCDPPRIEVPDSVVKARGAQIRVVLITDDQPTIAKAIAKQVNIFTSEIADNNGLDTFTRAQDQNGQIIFSLYRNERLLEQHISDHQTRIDIESNEDSDDRKEGQANDSITRSPRRLPWYKRLWTSYRNQCAEPKSDLPQVAKVTCIPYAIVVSDAFIS